MSEKNFKTVKIALLILTVAAAVKMIFFDYTLDEEYQMMMAYRNLNGDRLFGEMWEPHQTSAFMCIGLMGIYRLIVGSYTGVLIYLRICTTFIQIGLAIYVYRIFRRLTTDKYAFLLALIYFNVVPKGIQIPEFANMQHWFFSVMVLTLIQYYSHDGVRKKAFLIISGVAMALEVLSYPSCLILFPFFMVVIFIKSEAERWKDVLIYCGTCGACGAVWMLWILRRVSFEEFARNIAYLLEFDLTHDISGTNRTFNLQYVMIWGVLPIVTSVSIGLLLYFVIKKRNTLWNRGQSLMVLMVMFVLASEIVQAFYWVVLRSGFELPQIHLVALWLAGMVAWRYAGKQKYILVPGIIGAFLSLIAVIYISDLAIGYALPHGFLGPLFCALLMVWGMSSLFDREAPGWCYLLLISLCFISIFGKGYTLRDGRDYNTIDRTAGIIKGGPAAGILTDYMNAYIYNCNYDTFCDYVGAGDNVLIVTNMVNSEGTTLYMFEEANVCHYSIVDPTAYDERLLKYWELYPEKVPDIILVDCWYGQLYEKEDSWIMQYIENNFGYSEVHDTDYVRYYIR